MDDFGELLLKWNAAAANEEVATDRPRYLITTVVYFALRFFLSRTPQPYPAKQMAVALYWINAMCYDFHGSWDTMATGQHSAMYDPRSNISTSYGLESWIAVGVLAAKVAMGLPLYGRTWRLNDPSQHDVVAVGEGRSAHLREGGGVQPEKQRDGGLLIYVVSLPFHCHILIINSYRMMGKSWRSCFAVIATACSHV
ncbi:acidic mammalian chitinase-like [Canna indica]|uniref:Acidic mammalian chitinase-like n=1 Tax=Canna indica TaxID=4628 RepID=A0AAQ3K4Y0_9LILI|nr:acidic mammalian chitinase-like [Canna indica]